MPDLAEVQSKNARATGGEAPPKPSEEAGEAATLACLKQPPAKNFYRRKERFKLPSSMHFLRKNMMDNSLFSEKLPSTPTSLETLGVR